MDTASEELERRSRYLSSLIRRTKLNADPPEPEPSAGVGKDFTCVKERQVKEAKGKGEEGGEERNVSVRVRAADMPPALQRRAILLARDAVAAMPRLDSKCLALELKKEFDTSYGPAWHCVVGTSFGSYVTHSLGGFLYFSVDKVYILLFRTAVEPLSHPR